MDLIKHSVPFSEMLAGLAEECSELAQAALKLRRVITHENPTPITEKTAVDRLHEEIADVKLYVSMMDVDDQKISKIMEEKHHRWEQRLLEVRK